MDVIVLAGGEGTRIRAYSNVFPKPLLPVGASPVLELLLRRIARQGFRDVTLSVGHLAPLIQAYFGDGSRFGIRLRYVREFQPLNTAGPLTLVENLSETFVVMNGDLLTDLDLNTMIARHHAAGARVTLARAARTVRATLGVVETDEAGFLRAYHEKPSLHYQVSMGVYVMQRDVVDAHLEKGKPFGLPMLMLRLLAADEHVATYLHEGVWLDMDRPEDYHEACKLFASGSEPASR